MLTIKSFGKNKNRELQSLVDYYTKLSSKYFQIDIVGLDDTKKKIDKELLNKHIDSDKLNILLTEDGQELTTLQFANKLKRWKVSSTKVNLIIGGAHGFTKDAKSHIKLKLSLSKMTLQHDFALVILLEQIYRAGNIIAGGKYHK
jgi:23S rRNA (pseudouridine1915-N3)-methyltransferase